jgi:outer membrane protein
MKRVIGFSVLVLAFLCSSQLLSAQKCGHLNAGNLLASLPAVTAADKEMETYQKELMSKGEQMATAFQTKLNAYVAEVEKGTLSQVQRQERENVLQNERQQIAQYEQEVVAKVQQKRQALLQPILKRVDDAVQAVGKENGYQMIFDTSIPNAILFVEDTDNIETLVRKKLGL